jgi:hypothetical protein
MFALVASDTRSPLGASSEIRACSAAVPSPAATRRRRDQAAKDPEPGQRPRASLRYASRKDWAQISNDLARFGGIDASRVGPTEAGVD